MAHSHIACDSTVWSLPEQCVSNQHMAVAQRSGGTWYEISSARKSRSDMDQFSTMWLAVPVTPALNTSSINLKPPAATKAGKTLALGFSKSVNTSDNTCGAYASGRAPLRTDHGVSVNSARH